MKHDLSGLLDRLLHLGAGWAESCGKRHYRLDHARNQDIGNSGLGLAIARDIARSHGGDIALGKSALGGLRAIMRVPM